MELIYLLMLLPWFKIGVIVLLTLILLVLADVVKCASQCAFFLQNIQWNTRDREED